MSLTQVTIEEDFEQLMKDNQRINRIMMSGDEDIHEGMVPDYVRSVYANLSFFQKNYSGKKCFEALYERLRSTAVEQVKEVMRKYGMPIKNRVLEEGSG